MRKVLQWMKGVLPWLALVVIPVGIFLAGGELMNHIAKRGDLIEKVEATVGKEPLNQRWTGYDEGEARAWWLATRSAAANLGNADGLEIEREFLRLDLLFPFFYMGALAICLLLARRWLGHPFGAAAICVLALLGAGADWTENLTQLALLHDFQKALQEGVQEPTLSATLLCAASWATMLKLYVITAASLFLLALVVIGISRVGRPVPVRTSSESMRWEEVFEAELGAIRSRRPGEPAGYVRKHLVGLAFSGGGIRSATFGLGVLEGLKKHRILPEVDYLSTVSGGGYIGAWLSASCRRHADLSLDRAKSVQDFGKVLTTEWAPHDAVFTQADAARSAADAEARAAEAARIQALEAPAADKASLHTAFTEKAKDAKVAEAAAKAAEEASEKAAEKATATPKAIDARKGAMAASAPWLTEETSWENSIGHLRRYSKYLAPDVGFFSADTWSMVAVWFRNTLLVQLTVVFAIAVLLLVPRPLLTLFAGWPGVGHLRWLTVAIFVVAIAGIAGNQLRVSRGRDLWILDSRNWFLATLGAATCVGIGWFVGDQFQFDPFPATGMLLEPLAHRKMAAAFVMAFFLVLGGFLLLPTGARLAELATKEGEKVPEKVDYTQGWVQGAVVLPLMVTGYLVAAVLWGQVLQWKQTECPLEATDCLSKVDSFGAFLAIEWRYWAFPLYIAIASLWLLSFCSIVVRRERTSIRSATGLDWPRVRSIARRAFIVVFAPVPATLVLYLLLCAILLLLHGWIQDQPGNRWLAFVWGPSLVLYAFTLAIVMLIGMLGRQSIEAVREWWSRLGAWLGIYGFAWMVIAIVAVYGPKLAHILLDGGFWHKVSVTGGWLVTTLGALLAANSGSTGGASDGTEGRKSKADLVKEAIAAVGPFVFIAGLVILVSTVLHLIILSVGSNVDWQWANLDREHWKYLNAPSLCAILAALVLTLAVTLLLGWRVDINEFSLNAFYRNRLCRCYLGATRTPQDPRKPQNFTGFDEKDDLSMTDLAVSGTSAVPPGPLHIVNCALNLGGSSDLALHTRHSASFMITPYATGSGYIALDSTGKPKNPAHPLMGYRRTSEYGGLNGHPTLGQAISVSGAAASPNMGYHTSGPVAFFLTMFNARLGWWFPTPRRPSSAPSPSLSLKYLVAELFGVADDDSNFLNISDGGHFENLAAYELVRRRCRVIIISDGECDPKLQFEGLGTLIRMCEVDHGAKITLDVGSIRPARGTQWSANRCAVGTIDYSDCPYRGILIYLKASMTGHEDSAILQYKSGHPTFPHESTGNQFYGEDQFESYRALGREIADRTFKPVENLLGCEDKAGALVDIMAPGLSHVGRFTEHAKSLMSLWEQLGKNPAFPSLDSQHGTQLQQNLPGDLKPFREAFYLASQIIQLMENVYMDLDLENTWEHADNKGWRNTFGQWAKSPAIIETWKLISENYGSRFRYFCERELKLP